MADIDLNELMKMVSNMDKNELQSKMNEVSKMLNNTSPEELFKQMNNGNNNNQQNNSQNIPNIDANTMLKMQKIISAMNNSSDNSGANLLRSLKPYLKPSRQAKVDEYIQLFGMEKVIELMKQYGGDNKNDS